MMEEVFGKKLAEFAKGRTQPELADLFGVSQSAVSQMMKSGRDIRVRPLPDGSFEAFEIRPIGAKKKAA